MNYAPLKAFNLKRWIDEHRELLRPPIGAEMIWKDSQFMVMIIGGPNARRDFHINPGDEFFYQLEGNIVLEYIDRDGKRQRETIREGDVLLLPARTPHSAQRPAHSVGLVVERLREPSEAESYAWHCERCDQKLYELTRGKGICWRTCAGSRPSSTQVNPFVLAMRAGMCNPFQQDRGSSGTLALQGLCTKNPGRS